MRNTITDPQSRRKSTQFFESSFTGGATDDFLTKRTTPLNNGSPTPSAYSSQSKRRMSNFPQLSTGAGAPVITPLLPVDILPPALQGTISSPEKPK